MKQIYQVSHIVLIKLLFFVLILVNPIIVTAIDVLQPAKWSSFGPGGGGWIMSLALSPYKVNDVFLGGDIQGVFTSADLGGSWAAKNNGIRDYWIETIIFHPQNPKKIYAAGKSGVYISRDGGGSWEWSRGGFPSIAVASYSAPISALAIDINNPDTLYASVGSPRDGDGARGIIYKSIDDGRKWFKVNLDGELPKDALITSLVLSSIKDKIYISSQYGVFVSFDGGKRWSLANTGLPHTNVSRIITDPSNSNILYLTLYTKLSASWEGGVYKSIDSGHSWTEYNNGLQRISGKANKLISNYRNILIDPKNPQVLYLGSSDYVTNSIYKTLNGARDWFPVFEKPLKKNIESSWVENLFGFTVEAMAISPINSNIIFVGGSGAVFRTLDAGKSWSQVYTVNNLDNTTKSNGLELTDTRFILVDPNNHLRMFLGYQDIGLFISLDGGKSFSRRVGEMSRDTANTAYALALDPENSSHLWGCFGPWESRVDGFAFVESRDLGVSWTVKSKGLPNTRPCKKILFDSRNNKRRLMINVEGSGVYISDDGAKTWVKTTGLANNDVRDIIADPISLNTYWAVAMGNNKLSSIVYKSVDSGGSWRKVSNTNLQALDVKQLMVSKNKDLYIVARDKRIGKLIYSGGVFRSKDSGHTWERILSDKFAQTIVIDSKNIIYVGLTDHPYHDDSSGNGIKISRDDGENWFDISDIVPFRRIRVLYLIPGDNTKLFVGTSGNGFGVINIDWTVP